MTQTVLQAATRLRCASDGLVQSLPFIPRSLRSDVYKIVHALDDAVARLEGSQSPLPVALPPQRESLEAPAGGGVSA